MSSIGPARLFSHLAFLSALALPATPSTAQCTNGAGMALRLDGVDDYVEFGPGDLITDPWNRSFTVEAWLRPDWDAGLSPGSFAVATTYEPYCSDYGYSLLAAADSDSEVHFGAHLARIHCGNDFGLSSPTTDQSAWHHAANTFEVTSTSGGAAIGTLRLYVDGVLVAEQADVAYDAESQPVLKVGALSGPGHAPYPNFYYLGEIDEVRIWNRARSESELLCTMESSLTGLEEGLVGYWNFNEGSGQVAANGGNPASWTGAPFAWEGHLGGTTSVEASDPQWIVSDAPICIPDCDGNGVDDATDIANGTHSDVDGNGIPDACQALRVDDNALPGGDGLTWATAFSDLQEALAAQSDCRNQIWVAEGTYAPGDGSSLTATFSMRSGLSLFGGFAGNEVRADDRDPDLRTTELSGLMAGGRAYHVVTAVDVDSTAVIDGFLIRGGSASDRFYGNSVHSRGGGLYLSGSSLSVRNCRIESCSARQFGGGMYIGSGSPRVSDTVFHANRAELYLSRGGALADLGSSARYERCKFTSNRGDRGGALYLGSSASSIFFDCEITGNRTSYYYDTGGGALIEGGATPAFVECLFYKNSTYRGNGGGAACIGSSPSFLNCHFKANSARYGVGGAIYHSSTAGASIVNGLFAHNSSGVNYRFYVRGRGGAIYNAGSDDLSMFGCTLYANKGFEVGGAIYNSGSPTIEACVLWGNYARTGPAVHSAAGTPLLNYCNVQGGWSGSGTGNISTDPAFVNPVGADGFSGTLDDNFRLRSDSPCIDHVTVAELPEDEHDLDGDGDASEPLPFDLDGLERASDGDGDSVVLVDMGPYEVPPALLGSDFQGGETESSTPMVSPESPNRNQ